MPVTFKIIKSDNYFVCKYFGIINAAEVLESWENFLQGNEWIPGLNEFTDLSETNFKGVKDNDVIQLIHYIERVYKENHIASTKVAVYAPNDLPFGMARMYSIYADDSPELIHVFRDKEKAKKWLVNENTN